MASNRAGHLYSCPGIGKFQNVGHRERELASSRCSALKPPPLPLLGLVPCIGLSWFLAHPLRFPGPALRFPSPALLWPRPPLPWPHPLLPQPRLPLPRPRPSASPASLCSVAIAILFVTHISSPVPADLDSFTGAGGGVCGPRGQPLPSRHCGRPVGLQQKIPMEGAPQTAEPSHELSRELHSNIPLFDECCWSFTHKIPCFKGETEEYYLIQGFTLRPQFSCANTVKIPELCRGCLPRNECILGGRKAAECPRPGAPAGTTWAFSQTSGNPPPGGLPLCCGLKR